MRCLLLVLCTAMLLAADIDPALLVPGSVLKIPAPELGNSSQVFKDSQRQEPASLHLFLPKNYDRQRPHPVIVFLGGDRGSMARFSELRKATHEVNYILLGVEFSAPADRDGGLHNAGHAVQELAKVTAIDPEGLILVGEGNGARSINEGYGSKQGALFSAFAMVIHGTNPMDARRLQHVPILILGGSKDHNEHTDTTGIIVDQRRVYDQLAQGGVDATLVELAGNGHWWSSEFTPELTRWLEARAPIAERIRFEHLVRLVETSGSSRRQAWAKAELAKTWWRDVTREKRLEVEEKRRQEIEKKRLEAEEKARKEAEKKAKEAQDKQ